MRIISGLAKGRKILSPVGMNTRPTLDRIKQSIFNIIQNKVYGTMALDMFAGTGSLGLEAASRGAKYCYLVDKGAETYSFLKQNIENLGFKEHCEALNIDSYEALSFLSKKGIIFDLIFIDPPYCKDMIPPAINIICEKNLLSKDGIIVSKIDSSEIIYEGNEFIKVYDIRKYGNTTVCFYKFKEE
jgi:16S rRNA (guanine(966)-N(2))-methyltransferase RsmD